MKANQSFSRPEWFRLNGVYYGYPTCCIDHFIATSNINFARHSRTTDQNAVHQNLGFIPCPSCAAKIVSGKTTLHGLITNRFCPDPFPNDNNEMHKEYFISMLKKDFKLLHKKAV